MKDYFTQQQEKIAAKLIKQWKANESKLLDEYGSRENYFLQAEAKELWKSEQIRSEFDHNFETLQAYLKNESRVKTHTSRSKRFTKKDAPVDDQADDTALKAKWKNSKALRDEFDGDFDAYAAYEQNKNRVKILA